jgi:hypothetical protein
VAAIDSRSLLTTAHSIGKQQKRPSNEGGPKFARDSSTTPTLGLGGKGPRLGAHRNTRQHHRKSLAFSVKLGAKLVKLVGAENARRERSSEMLMTGFRFIRKDGQSVDMAVIRKRFFEVALDSGSGPERASQIWNDMLFGDPWAQRLIEKVCEIEIVDADTGFGFLE